MHQSSKVADVVETYRDLFPLYQQFGTKVGGLLEDLLTASNIKYQIVDVRAKTVESFAEKIQRDGKTYKNPLTEISDLAGVRLIFYYDDDVNRACELIDREFIIDHSQSIDKRQALAPDQFGYLSVHRVVSLSESRTDLPEWQLFEDLVAEIQVRTVLQHAWATISHALQYKREADIPYQFRRQLMRVSGLLELADDEFANLRQAQASLRQRIVERVSEGDLEIPIDALSLEEFLQTSNTVRTIYELAIHAGFESSSTYDEANEVGGDNHGLSQLVQACNDIGIENIENLENQLNTYKPHIQPFFVDFLARRKEVAGEIVGDAAHVMAAVLVAAHYNEYNTDQVVSILRWSPDYAEDVLGTGKAHFS